LRVLLVRYPREQWHSHANLGDMARFWLSRHAMFCELSGAIEQVTAQFRAGHLPPAEFARQFVPRLQFMLDQLNVHHQIEDLHYFPIFQAAEARLAARVRRAGRRSSHSRRYGAHGGNGKRAAAGAWRRSGSATALQRRLCRRERDSSQGARSPSR
jgi:hypothetical protein